ncbi:hypothetical protein L2E82_02163 [Cichorium intybus]|uniref:Uncharacterized protein n=1 Tax=Cichorium intybus TaxID=13427 RepID=A0ACB9H1Z4_CICIN|nr:hypothetical protein L2E82_02163 [Cichorium intybus]
MLHRNWKLSVIVMTTEDGHEGVRGGPDNNNEVASSSYSTFSVSYAISVNGKLLFRMARRKDMDSLITFTSICYFDSSNANKRFMYDVGVCGSDDEENGMAADFLSEMTETITQNKLVVLKKEMKGGFNHLNPSKYLGEAMLLRIIVANMPDTFVMTFCSYIDQLVYMSAIVICFTNTVFTICQETAKSGKLWVHRSHGTILIKEQIHC